MCFINGNCQTIYTIAGRLSFENLFRFDHFRLKCCHQLIATTWIHPPAKRLPYFDFHHPRESMTSGPAARATKTIADDNGYTNLYNYIVHHHQSKISFRYSSWTKRLREDFSSLTNPSMIPSARRWIACVVPGSQLFSLVTKPVFRRHSKWESISLNTLRVYMQMIT